MTLVIRVESPPVPLDLGAAGWCRVSLGALVGAFPSATPRVVWLGLRRAA